VHDVAEQFLLDLCLSSNVVAFHEIPSCPDVCEGGRTLSRGTLKDLIRQE
jgi:hypothetical protein